MENSINRVENGLQNLPITKRCTSAVSRPARRNDPGSPDSEIPRAINHYFKQRRILAKVLPSLACETVDPNLSRFRASQNASCNKNIYVSSRSNVRKQRIGYVHAKNDIEKSQIEGRGSQMDEISQICEGSRVVERSQKSGKSQSDKSYVGDRSQISERSTRVQRSQIDDKSQTGNKSQLRDRSRSYDRSETKNRTRVGGGSHHVTDNSQTSERSYLGDTSHLGDRSQMGDGSYMSGIYNIIDASQKGEKSETNERSQVVDRSQLSEKSKPIERSHLVEKSRKSYRSQISDRSQNGERLQSGEKSQIGEKSYLAERPPICDRSQAVERSHACEKSQASERSQIISEKSRIAEKSRLENQCHFGNPSLMDEKARHVKKKLLISEKSHKIDTPVTHDKTEVRWLCIPGEVPWIEQHSVVPASPSEVRRVRKQLFCRPAEGFGQNWFQLQLKDVPHSTLSISQGKDSTNKGCRSKQSTSKAKSKVKRQSKRGSPKVSPKVSPKISPKLSPNISPKVSPKITPKNSPKAFKKTRTKVKGQTTLKFTQTNKKMPTRYSINNQTFRLASIPKRTREISFGPADRECNNSNETNLHLPGSPKQSRTPRFIRSITGRIIRVEGDGRCLFRSLVTCLSPELQKARRDDFGSPVLKSDANYETLMADALRALVVKLMMDNSHFYKQLERIVINADQPWPLGYSHFQDRLTDMTLTSTMPGDLELNATSTALERQVLVLDVNLRPIVIYGKERFPESEVVAVRYTRLGQDVGHYDAFIPDCESINALDIGTSSENESDVKQDNLMSIRPDAMDFLSHLVSGPRDRTMEKKDVSGSKSCPEGKKLLFQRFWRQQQNHQYDPKRQQQDEERKNYRYNSENCNMMDWSPVASSTAIDEATTQTSLFDIIVNSNNNDNKSHKKLDGSDSKTPSENKNLRSDSYIQSRCNQMLLDFLTDNVKFVVRTEENTNENRKKRGDGAINETNSRSCSKKKRRASDSAVLEKCFTDHNLCFKSSTWKTRKHRSRAVVKKRNKNGKRFRGKSCRKIETKSGGRKRKCNATTTKWSDKKQSIIRARQHKKNAKKIPVRSLSKLVKEKVDVSNHCKTSHGLSKKKDEEVSQTNDEEIFPKEPGEHLDETLKKGRPGPRCEKSIDGTAPKVSPPKENLISSRNNCFVCKLPVTQYRRLCTLCGRVAHKMCVPSNLKGSDGLYFVCSFCVHV